LGKENVRENKKEDRKNKISI